MENYDPLANMAAGWLPLPAWLWPLPVCMWTPARYPRQRPGDLTARQKAWLDAHILGRAWVVPAGDGGAP